MIGNWIQVLSVLVSTGPPVIQERLYEWSWGMHPMWWMWGAGGLVMMFMMLVFWGLVIWGIVVGVRWLVHQGRDGCPDHALEIQYAWGSRSDPPASRFTPARVASTPARASSRDDVTTNTVSVESQAEPLPQSGDPGRSSPVGSVSA